MGVVGLRAAQQTKMLTPLNRELEIRKDVTHIYLFDEFLRQMLRVQPKILFVMYKQWLPNPTEPP